MSSSNDRPSTTIDFDAMLSSTASVRDALLLRLQPAWRELQNLHASGEAHGAIGPDALRFDPTGELNIDHFLRWRTAGAPAPPQYVAPEHRAGGAASVHGDYYSCGALIYQIVDGSSPPEQPQFLSNRLMEIQGERPEWRELAAVILRCVNPVAVRRNLDFDSLIRLTGDTRMLPPTQAPSVPAASTAQHAITAEAASSATIQSPAASEVRIATAPVAEIRMPNASVGKPYSETLSNLLRAAGPEITIEQLELPSATGLQFVPETQSVEGTPKSAGEWHQIKVRFRSHADSHNAPGFRTVHLSLIINPDPSTLWQSLPSDPSGEYAKDDTDCKAVRGRDLLLLAASMRGRSHAHEGTYREDDFGLQYTGNTGWYIVVVADGAGSAKYSRRGSQIACERACTVLFDKLAQPNDLDTALAKLNLAEHAEDLEKAKKLSCNLCVAAAYESLSAIQTEASARGASLKDFATTYISVLAKKLKDGWFITSFAIGDGGSGVLVRAGAVEILTKPDSGAFAGQTLFLTHAHLFRDAQQLLERTHAVFVPDFRLLAAMSDGITDPVFGSDARFADAMAWDEWVTGLGKVIDLESPDPEMRRELLDSLDFFSPGNHDDRTLVVAVPLREAKPERTLLARSPFGWR